MTPTPAKDEIGEEAVRRLHDASMARVLVPDIMESFDYDSVAVACRALLSTRAALASATEERDRLRAALEKIADGTAATWVQDEARSALRTGEEERG